MFLFDYQYSDRDMCEIYDSGEISGKTFLCSLFNLNDILGTFLRYESDVVCDGLVYDFNCFNC